MLHFKYMSCHSYIFSCIENFVSRLRTHCMTHAITHSALYSMGFEQIMLAPNIWGRGSEKGPMHIPGRCIKVDACN